MSKYRSKFYRKFFKDSRMKFIRSQSIWGIKTFHHFYNTFIWNVNVAYRRSWLLKYRDLTFRSFGENICKLTIELISLLSFRFSQTTTISPFERRDILIVFPLTVGIPTEVFGVTLISPTNLLTYKSCCFLISALIWCLSSWNLDLSLLPPVFFAFAWVLFLFWIFLLISNVIQGTEATDLLVLEGMYFSTASCMKEVIKSNLSFPGQNENQTDHWNILFYPLQSLKNYVS